MNKIIQCKKCGSGCIDWYLSITERKEGEVIGKCIRCGQTIIHEESIFGKVKEQ